MIHVISMMNGIWFITVGFIKYCSLSDVPDHSVTQITFVNPLSIPMMYMLNFLECLS